LIEWKVFDALVTDHLAHVRGLGLKQRFGGCDLDSLGDLSEREHEVIEMSRLIHVQHEPGSYKLLEARRTDRNLVRAGGKLLRAKFPSLVVFARVTTPVSVFVTATAAFGIAAPFVSLTVPSSEAVIRCARSDGAPTNANSRRHRSVANVRALRMIDILCQ
jgi:hypothetical protein